MNKFTNTYLKKKYIILIILFILLIISLSSFVYYINPGHIGILVYKIPPDIHNTKGILETPAKSNIEMYRRSPRKMYISKIGIKK